jgi:hypothetical protein
MSDKPMIRGPRPGGYKWIVQIMPAEGWHAVYYHSGSIDGADTQPLIGWAIREDLIKNKDLADYGYADDELIVERQVVGLIVVGDEVVAADSEWLSMFSNFSKFLGYVQEFDPDEWQEEVDVARKRYAELAVKSVSQS